VGVRDSMENSENNGDSLGDGDLELTIASYVLFEFESAYKLEVNVQHVENVNTSNTT
jgi:hypothetical protein